MNQEEIASVAQKLLDPGFLFDRSQHGLLPLRIQRDIGPNECVEILPTLERIYRLNAEGKFRKSTELISELTGLLIAAELGIAKQFLIELEVKKTLPRALKVLTQDLIDGAGQVDNRSTDNNV